jgi:hypothetical protein
MDADVKTFYFVLIGLFHNIKIFFKLFIQCLSKLAYERKSVLFLLLLLCL